MGSASLLTIRWKQRLLERRQNFEGKYFYSYEIPMAHMCTRFGGNKMKEKTQNC